MKRLLTVFTLLVLFTIPLLADPSSSDTGNVTVSADPANVKVNFDLGATSGNNTWEIGFTDNVDNLSNGSVEHLTSEDVALVINGNHGELPAGKPLYVYWIITGGQKLKIELSASGELKGTPAGGNEESMNWKVTWNSSESGSGNSDTGGQTLGNIAEYNEDSPSANYTSPQRVFTRNVLDQSLEYGSAELKIETQDITDVIPASYSAELTLNISPI